MSPHLYESGRGEFLDRPKELFYSRQRVLPDRALAPTLALHPALIGGAHGFPSEPLGMPDVLGGALGTLLMDQVKVSQGWLLVRL